MCTNAWATHSAITDVVFQDKIPVLSTSPWGWSTCTGGDETFQFSFRSMLQEANWLIATALRRGHGNPWWRLLLEHRITAGQGHCGTTLGAGMWHLCFMPWNTRPGQILKIIELFELEGTFKITLLQWTGTPTDWWSAQCPLQPDLECFQGRSIHHLHGQPVPVPHHT